MSIVRNHHKALVILLSGFAWLTITPSTYAQQKTSAAQALSLSTLKLYIQYATVISCLPHEKDTTIFQTLRKSSKAFGLIFEKSYGNRLENSKEPLATPKAESVFANEVAIQLLSVCPKSLNDSERTTIEALRVELIKRRSTPPARR